MCEYQSQTSVLSQQLGVGKGNGINQVFVFIEMGASIVILEARFIIGVVLLI